MALETGYRGWFFDAWPGLPRVIIFGSSGFTVTEYSLQRLSPCGIAARYSTGQEFAEGLLKIISSFDFLSAYSAPQP